MKPLAAALALCLCGPAVAATADKPPPDPGQCFNVRTVNNRFTRVDNRTVNVGVDGKDVWRLRIIGPCGGIDWTLPATLKSRTGGSTICAAGDIDLYAPSPLGPRICRVQAMRKLTPAEVSALPRNQRP
jgi:hypothetical protein